LDRRGGADPDPLAPWRDDPAALIPVRVTPRAGAAGLSLDVGPDGAPCLRVRVTMAAEGGKANAAVLALVARAAGAPPSAFSVARGATARTKLLRWTR
jgi:uncharacterized protein YggU (UPF0235/DUF167 family)